MCIHTWPSSCLLCWVLIGATRTIKNNEKQTPYDLSAKNPEVGKLLMIHTGKNVFLGSSISISTLSHLSLGSAEGYGEEEEDGDDD